jgi:hypothetical protein
MSVADHGAGSGSGDPDADTPSTMPAYPAANPTGYPSGSAGRSPDPQTPQWEEPMDEEDLIGPEPARRLPWVTGLLALTAVAAAAFWGGVWVQKHHDRHLVSTTAAASTAATGRARGAGGFGGAGGGFGGGAGATVGQVKLVDGSTIYVTDTSGNTVTVKTTGSSQFTKQTSVGLKDVQPGDAVIIRGAAQSDGSISAATLSDNGPAGTTGATGARSGAGGAGATGGTGATGGAGAGAGAAGAGD